MSYDLNVFLKRQNMPDPAVWRAAILDAGFPVEIDPAFDVDGFTGFLPCSVEGEPAGFEYYSRAVSADEAGEMDLETGSDFCVLITAGSMPQEIVAALAASGALASLSGGVLFDTESGESYLAGAALAWAKARIAQI